MKKHFLVSIIYLFIHLTSVAQIKLSDLEQQNFKTLEKELLKLSNTFLNGNNIETRTQANEAFINLLDKTLHIDNAFFYPFDSLTTISILNSTDKKLRIFNWELKNNINSYTYFGFILLYNKEQNKTFIYKLNDKSESIKKPEIASLNNDNWYGAHYYKLVENKAKKRTNYYLLGIDWNNSISRKKIIEVLSFTKDGHPKFGENIFKIKNQSYQRYIMEYSAEISASLKFNDKENAFIMDNLVPKNPSLKGQFQFYGPDMTYNAFILNKGKLTWKEDYDARNAKSDNDKFYNNPSKNTVNPTNTDKK